MRLPGVRFTVRRMMLAVAGVAVVTAGALWGARLLNLSVSYRAVADKHDAAESLLRLAASQAEAEAGRYEALVAEAERQLAVVTAEGIKPEYDLKSEQGVEFELLRSGIPQAAVAKYESTVRLLKARIRDNGPMAQAARSAASSEKAYYEYHATLRRKYERAASSPWWSLEPDPPPPTSIRGVGIMLQALQERQKRNEDRLTQWRYERDAGRVGPDDRGKGEL